MKKLKNNKGITGVDITASIVVLMIAVGIISTMYSKYINNSKLIKRNTEANNLAIDFIQYIETTDFDIIDSMFDEYGVDTNNDGIADKFEVTAEAEDDIIDVFGIEVKEQVYEIPSSYKVLLSKKEEIDGIAMKVSVDVIYSIASKEEKISLNTIKTRVISQVNSPDMEAEKVKSFSKDGNTRFVLKYSNIKEGYIQANFTDNDWYSISGKRYPVVVYAKEEDMDVNGVIEFKEDMDIYVWVPRFGKIDTENYGFCYQSTDNMIVYGDTGTLVQDTADDTTYSIIGYTVDTSKILTNIPTEFKTETGKWVKINSNLNPIDDSGDEITDEDNIFTILKTKQFTWN